MLTREAGEAFVTRWIDAWNRHDLEAVMAMVAPDVEFVSPFVVTMYDEPSGVLRGREALEGWFGAALRLPDFHIEPPLHVLVAVDTVCLVERINGTVAANVFTLDDEGRVVRSVVHG